RERAALAWTEAVTLIAQSHTPDADWEALRAEFSEDEAAYLTFAIAAINLWNRTQIAFRVAHATELPAERARVA
ncbi:carboxymuconolactone decarboxylase family protein, partial [Rhodovulum sulfidophilum]|nr:carboxymuconolactone decarboxylase family protein [Rhodovulum sulfidophilum]